jgi:hypothetical protein
MRNNLSQEKLVNRAIKVWEKALILLRERVCSARVGLILVFFPLALRVRALLGEGGRRHRLQIAGTRTLGMCGDTVLAAIA